MSTKFMQIEPGDMTRYAVIVDSERQFLAIGTGGVVKGIYIPDYWEACDIDEVVKGGVGHHYVRYYMDKTGHIPKTALVAVLVYLMISGNSFDTEKLRQYLGGT